MSRAAGVTRDFYTARMSFARSSLVLAAAVALTGCASTQYPPCWLVGACASITQASETLVPPKPPQAPLPKLCVAPLTARPGTQIRVTTVGAKATEAGLAGAQAASQQIVGLYQRNAPAMLVQQLQARGVQASVCSAGTMDVGARLRLSVVGISSDNGGAGARMQLDVNGELAVQESSASAVYATVWKGTFKTGSRMAITTADEENVKAFAENVAAELSGTGWVAKPQK